MQLNKRNEIYIQFKSHEVYEVKSNINNKDCLDIHTHIQI